MGKVQWNSINKKQNGLEKLKKQKLSTLSNLSTPSSSLFTVA